MTMHYLTIVVFLWFFWCRCGMCAPMAGEQPSPPQRYANHDAKKDIFISRGWGAGGMPFSVLYMNPSFSSSKAPATVAEAAAANGHYKQPQLINQHQPQHAKSLPQVRTSMRQKGLNRTPHSVIPQLFVSYGWGPLGKK